MRNQRNKTLLASRLAVFCLLLAALFTAQAQIVGEVLSPWTAGTLEVRNVMANGEVWTGVGNTTRQQSRATTGTS